MHVDDEHWAALLAVLDAFDDEHGCSEGDDAAPIHERVSRRLAEAAKVDKADLFEGEYMALRELMLQVVDMLPRLAMGCGGIDGECAHEMWLKLNSVEALPTGRGWLGKFDPLMATVLRDAGWTVTPPGGEDG